MKPVLFEFWFIRVYGYGLMMVLGFLCAIFLARWRARKAGENPDQMTQCGLLALVGGVAGSRIAYIIQHWDAQFAHAPHPLLAMVNITSGGLIYYGGLILTAMLVGGYLLVKRLPVRRYLDILAISAMVGLAFGRAGCLLNGCCFGARCDPAGLLAQRFPMYSKPLWKLPADGHPYAAATQGPTPVYEHQFHLHQVWPDERLVLFQPTIDNPLGVAVDIHPPRYLHGALANDPLAVLSDEAAWDRLFATAAGGDGRISEAEWSAALARGDGQLRGGENWNQAMAFDADRDQQLARPELAEYFRFAWGRLLATFDRDGDRRLAGQEYQQADAYLQADEFALADASRSAAVAPAQALGIVNALLVAGVLSVLYRLRRREGQVLAAMLIAYPVVRFLEESIRDDNIHDLAGLVFTHNQVTSMVLLAVGIVMLVALQWTPPASASRRRGGTNVSRGGAAARKVS